MTHPASSGERLIGHGRRTWAASAWANIHRCGLAIASIALHNSAMTPDLTDDDKAILGDRRRAT